MANGNGSDFWTGIPAWARTIAVVGAPTVGAAYLVILLGGLLTGDVRSIRTDVMANSAQTMQNSKSIDSVRAIVEAQRLESTALRVELNSQLAVLIRLQAATCNVMAPSEAARSICNSAAK